MANNGEEALSKIQSQKFDLVLLDEVMPHLNGFEVLSEIKKDERFQKLPVVIMSNFGRTSEMVKGQELGMTGYIVKSDLSLDMMVQKIEELLKKN